MREVIESAGTVKEDSPKTKLRIWHQRMGPLNERDLKRVVKDGGIVGAAVEAESTLPTCETCLKGKFARSPFPKESTRSTEPLVIVHTDMCGPTRVESMSGAKYVVTFTGDYSRWCEIKFLKKKSDLLKTFKDYKVLVENQCGRKIQHLQSDNGTEYCNKEFDDFLAEHGTKRRLTVTHTPQ